MSEDWIAVFEALKGVYGDGGFSNITISEAVSHHRGCRGSFVRSFAKGVIRDTMRLDFIIGELAEKGLKGIKTRPLIILRMGIYAIESLDSVPEYAAVNEAVSLARKVSKGTDRFINAVLRSYIRKADEIKIPENPELKYSIPEPVFNLLARQYGDETDEIADALNTAPPLILRANTIKNTRAELIKSLKNVGFEASAVPESEIAVKASGEGITGTDLYRGGYFTIQSLSSIKAIEAFSPEKGEKILDLCAAPGGKSTAIAEMMSDSGEITACDIYEHRLELINASAARLGLGSIKTCLNDASVHIPEWDELYDKVLADVPCSGLGTARSKPEIKYRIDAENLRELEDLQLSILKNAYSYVKPGGILEYSTCTLNKDENEEIVLKLLKDTASAAFVEMRTILPYNDWTGFYYCIIRKNAY